MANQADEKDKDKATEAVPAALKLVMKDGLELYPHIPMPEFDRGPVKAYGGKSVRFGNLIVLVSERSAIPRFEIFGSYQNIKNIQVMRLVESGVVVWPHDQVEKYIFCYAAFQGKPIIPEFKAMPQKPMPEEWLTRVLIRSVVGILTEFRDFDFVHGHINLTNIFVQGSGDNESMILGECVSLPMGYGQSPLYLPIDTGMAQPSGRGHLTAKHDIYAFGICVAICASGVNPEASMSDDEIIQSKIEHGSYITMVGRERMPAGITEFLRGVLNDDHHQRWDVDDILKWLEGRRLSPKQSRVYTKAPRPLTIGEEKYYTLAEVASGVIAQPREAIPVIQQSSTLQWFKRNFDDKRVLDNIESLLRAMAEDTQIDKMVAKVAIALDPRAPVRYRGYHVMPEGFGYALAETIAKGKDVAPLAEIVGYQLFNYWYQNQPETLSDANQIITKFEKCRNVMLRRAPVYGIERVLYLTCKDTPCMSPLLTSFYVMNSVDLLKAFEKMAQQPQRGRLTLDRHMMAFLSEREARSFDPHAGHFLSQERGQTLLGVLKSLAYIQKAHKAPPMPKLTEWFFSEFDDTIKRLYNRDLRKKVKERLSVIAKSGDLNSFLNAADDPQVIKEDMLGYAFAQKEYAALEIEKTKIKTGLANSKRYGIKTAQETAMYIASGGGVFLLIIYLIYFFAGR